MRGRDDSWTNRAQDDEFESAVLHRLLALHPAQVTLAEVTLDIAGEGAGFGERDAVERAIRDLAAAGLLHRNGELLAPSRAALRFSELAAR
jgi:hypothetical protein